MGEGNSYGRGQQLWAKATGDREVDRVGENNGDSECNSWATGTDNSKDVSEGPQ